MSKEKKMASSVTTQGPNGMNGVPEGHTLVTATVVVANADKSATKGGFNTVIDEYEADD